MGVTGTPGANILAREADLIVGVGTRYATSQRLRRRHFRILRYRFLNVNVCEFDAGKQARCR